VTALRIAIVYPFFAHYRAALLRELSLHGRHDYHLFADTHDRRYGIATLDLSGERRFHAAPVSYLSDSLMWQHGLLRLTLLEDFDAYIFLGNAEWPATWLAAAAARLRGRKVYFWTHGWTAEDRGVRKWVRLLFYRLAHGLLLYGQHACAIGARLGYPQPRMHVIYNSLDFDEQTRLLADIDATGRTRTRRELFADPHAPVVLAAARLTAVKRFDLLFTAVAQLANAGHRVNCLIVGDGPERSRLEALASRLGIAAHFCGACYDERQLARLFAIANVTVSPGNIGLACMHSLGYGVPVITHDDPRTQGPEWEAIVPGQNGELFRQDCANSLAVTIRKWTHSEQLTEEERERYRRSIELRYHPRAQRLLIEQALAASPTTERSRNARDCHRGTRL
jgi:glycosyltransferase involved in cell wall biosynthesis